MSFKKIMAGFMAAALLFTTAGCTGRNEKARVAMEDAFGSYMSKVLGSKDASDYVDADEEASYSVTPVQEEILKCMLKKADYEITESEAVAKDKAGSITIKFKYPDVQGIADEYFDDELEDLLDDIAHSSKKFFLKKRIKIDLVQVDGSWLVTKKSDSKFKKELQEIVGNIYLEPYYIDPGIKPLSMNKVGIDLPTEYLMRWAYDGERLKKGLEDKGYEVDLRYADNDTSQQRTQIMDMVETGCSVIIIAAIDGSSLGGVLELAEENGITVIAYDRLIYNTDTLDYYITFDNYLLGAMQGRYIVEQLHLDSPEAGKVYNIEFTAGDPSDINAEIFFQGAFDVLMPYITKGVLDVPSGQMGFGDAATDVWSTERAKTRAENIIGAYYLEGAVIDAWLCSNDSTALGVEQALEKYYSGPYPVITGQDCDITNVKNIINGKQAMSVFKDTRILTDKTVSVVDDILNGRNVAGIDMSRYHNGVMQIPTILCSPVLVDINNYKEILIDSGYYTEDMLT
jgi:putative multiple sugar transport system substrate-binding protein